MKKKIILKKLYRYIFKMKFLPKLFPILYANETWLRLRPIKIFFKLIDPAKTKKIIDIGGGSGRLEKALKRTDVHIHDTNKDAIEKAKTYFKNASVSNGRSLDFKDDTFDWAISVHTLEHIPKENREKFILEMIRISKEGVFFNFPEGDYAAKLCENFLAALKKNGKEENKWTREHLEMGLPKLDDIKTILKNQDKFIFKYKLIRNYHAETLHWTNIIASENSIKTLFLSPYISLKKILKYKKSPTIEMILIGSRNEKIANDFIKKI